MDHRGIALIDRVGGPVFRARVGLARQTVADDDAAWGLDIATATVVALAPIVGAGAVAAAHFVRPLYRFLTAEDSVLEWMQFFCLAATTVILALVVRALVRRREWAWAALFAAGAAGVFLVAGEEISWGQRLFGLETPAGFQGVNTQGELNLHNVRGVLRVVNLATLIGAGVLTALPLVLAGFRAVGLPIWDRAWRVVPPIALVSAFLLPFGYRLLRLVTASGTSGSFAEAVELSLYFGLLVFALLIRRRLAAEGPAGPADLAG
jgi:hypothetical protein